MSTKFGVFLSSFIEENNLKLEYIANKTDSSKTSISLYCKGERIPKDDFIKKFLTGFNISSQKAEEIIRMVLLDRTPEEIKEEIVGLENKIKSIAGKNLKNIDVIHLKKDEQVYSKLKLYVKGHVIYKDDLVKSENYIYTGKTLIDEVNEKCFFIKLDSEDSQMPKGGFLLIDPHQKEIIDSKIYLIKFEEKEYLKRIIQTKKDIIVLKSLNNGTNDIYTQIEDIEIKGRAVKINYEEDL